MPEHYDETARQAALQRLHANGGCVRQTARELNIPRSTLRGWAAAEPAAQSATQTNGHDTSPPPETTPPAAQTGTPDNATALDTGLARLQAGLLANAALLLDAMPEHIATAPLNQQAAALGVLLDRLLKLDEWRRITAPHEQEQVIRFEFRYPDGTTRDTPPWADADSADDGTLPGGRLWQALWQDGDGQTAVD